MTTWSELRRKQEQRRLQWQKRATDSRKEKADRQADEAATIKAYVEACQAKKERGKA